MKYLGLLFSLIITLVLGSMNASWSADYLKGYAAFEAYDYETAFSEWISLAEQGDALSQDAIGLLYLDGKGVSQNYETSLKWFKLSAEQGYAPAQNTLGTLYKDGLGVSQDYGLAAKWFILSAQQGDSFAQYNLGVMYERGLVARTP